MQGETNATHASTQSKVTFGLRRQQYADKAAKEPAELAVTAHAFGPRNDYTELHLDLPTYWMADHTPSVANPKLTEREVCMRNSRKQVRRCMDRHILTLFPPSTQYMPRGLLRSAILSQ